MEKDYEQIMRALWKIEQNIIFEETGRELASHLNDSYEDIAVEVGWSTQDKCRVPFDRLPEANRRVMLKLALGLQVRYTTLLIEIQELRKTVEAMK